jgi:hypothetical protein
MNHRLRQRQGEDSLQAPSKHGVGDDTVYTNPSGFGSIHIRTRTEDGDLAFCAGTTRPGAISVRGSSISSLSSSDANQLAFNKSHSVHHPGRQTEDDDLRNSIEEERASSESHGAQYPVPVGRRGFLPQRPRRSHGRITPMPSDTYLASSLVESTNTDRPCWCDPNEERPANAAVDLNSPSVQRASRNEQDLYSATNRTDQPPHNFNVPGWLQQLGTPAGDYSYNDGLRGSSGVVSRTMIEISPGVNVRLRGADETWDCIGRDFFMPCTCLGCSQELCCIQDATFVLCPACRVVSPMDNNTSCCSEETNETFSCTATGSQHQGGVGLGFTFDNLMKWQAGIIQRRQSQPGNCL